MRGEVLKPDDAEGPGLILGDDGKQYHYLAARVHKGAALAAGAAVDFVGLGDDARDIYPVAAAPAPPAAATRSVASDAPARPDSLFKYFRRCLWTNYFQFNGRARRREYWGFVLFQIITFILCILLDIAISYAVYGTVDLENDQFLPVCTVVFYLYVIIPGIAVAVRRLHDRGLSGWLYLINIIPYIGGFVLFILMLLDSDPKTNVHGPNPKLGDSRIPDAFL